MSLDRAIAAYRAGHGLPTAARTGGVSISTLRRRLLSAGLMRGPREAAVEARGMGKYVGRATRGPTRDRAAFRERYAATRLSNARGLSLKSSGYIEITCGPDAGRSQHRLVAEANLGRALRADEVVHHRNHDRSDNRIENLEVMTRAEHSALHARENAPNRRRSEKGQFA